jgi:N-acetylglucosamine kinase-like BadF-type ATPase
MDGDQMGYIIGVDGGGTKTLALLGDLDGNVLARGVSGPSNANAVGFEAACLALEHAIRMARKNYSGQLSAMCLGLAGAGRKEDIERFQSWAIHKFPGTAVKVVSDAEVLLTTGAPSGPALALICGTGSIVYGRTLTGELIRAGGWGYLFGDEGSGYAMGSAALRAVMQAYDERGPETILSELILARYGLSTPPELVHKIYGAESPRLEVATLSDLVEQGAERGDSVAISILEEAAQALVRTVAALYLKLGTSPASLVITGGTILHGSYLKKAFHRACETQRLAFTEVRYMAEPADGALRLAHQLSLG